MNKSAIIYCENEFGKLDGKVANGLVRQSGKYHIVGVIDSSKAGFDAGEYLDQVFCGIPIFQNTAQAIDRLKILPKYFIYGIAPLTDVLDKDQQEVIFNAMKIGMDIVSGLPAFLSDDASFIKAAQKYGVTIHDVRKPPPRKDLHFFTGQIYNVKTPVITVSGTDCAVGKRTTAMKLVEALGAKGIKAVFVTTGQTGLLQGSKYGIAIDVLTSGFATGEVENAVLQADKEQPDIIVVEGQGALSHQAFTSSAAIIRGAMPKAIILQHPPKRINRCDFPDIPMPTLESEIDMLQVYSNAPVIAITLNHENMSEEELSKTIISLESYYDLPTTDVLKDGCDKLVNALIEHFPELSKSVVPECLVPE